MRQFLQRIDEGFTLIDQRFDLIEEAICNWKPFDIQNIDLGAIPTINGLSSEETHSIVNANEICAETKFVAKIHNQGR